MIDLGEHLRVMIAAPVRAPQVLHKLYSRQVYLNYIILCSRKYLALDLQQRTDKKYLALDKLQIRKLFQW